MREGLAKRIRHLRGGTRIIQDLNRLFSGATPAQENALIRLIDAAKESGHRTGVWSGQRSEDPHSAGDECEE